MRRGVIILPLLLLFCGAAAASEVAVSAPDGTVHAVLSYLREGGPTAALVVTAVAYMWLKPEFVFVHRHDLSPEARLYVDTKMMQLELHTERTIERACPKE